MTATRSLRVHLALTTLALLCGGSGCSKKRCETVKHAPWPLAEQVAQKLGDGGKLCSIEKALSRSTSRFHVASLRAKFELDAKSRAELLALQDRVVALLAKQGYRPDAKRTHHDRIVTAPARPAKAFARDATSGTLMRYVVAKDGSSAVNVMAFLMAAAGYAVIELHRLEGPANIVQRPVAGRKRLASFAAAVKRALAGKVDTLGPPTSCDRKPVVTVFSQPKVLAWRMSRPLVLDAAGPLALSKDAQRVMTIAEFNLLDGQLERVEGGYLAFYRMIKQTKRKRFKALSSRALGPNMRLAQGHRSTETQETGSVRVARADSGELVFAGKLTFIRQSGHAGLEAALKDKLGRCANLQVQLWDHKRARVE